MHKIATQSFRPYLPFLSEIREYGYNMFLRRLLHRFLPAHFHDPAGLFLKLIKSRDPAALFTIGTSALTALALPIDLMLQVFENRLYRETAPPKLPLIFLTGPPRSGTTLAAQVLINHLPVNYFNNLTSVFQRSPIVANKLCKNFIRKVPTDYRSYYGKTIKFTGPNDGLHIWDRWLGEDRTRFKKSLTDKEINDMIRFFGAYEQSSKRPFLNKNNNLIAYANLISDVFANSHFICIERDPLYLVQSLLIARIDIHGNVNVPYGLNSQDPKQENGKHIDSVEDTCKQVLFYERIIREQQRIIGPEKFWTIGYEDFCKNPKKLVVRVSEEILHQDVNVTELRSNLSPFNNANTRKLDQELFLRIQQTLHRLRMDS